MPRHMYSFHPDIQSTKYAMCIYATYNEQDLAIHIETNHQQMKILSSTAVVVQILNSKL